MYQLLFKSCKSCIADFKTSLNIYRNILVFFFIFSNVTTHFLVRITSKDSTVMYTSIILYRFHSLWF